MDFTATVLLASIDHTLATVRAALAAGADPEQLDEAKTELAARAGADVAVLTHTALKDEWQGVPESVFEYMRQVQDVVGTDLQEAERLLAAAREEIGGRSA